MPPQIRKSIRQMKYERGEVLQTLLQKISKEVEGELCGIGVGRD
jgi:hypothetical protein